MARYLKRLGTSPKRYQFELLVEYLEFEGGLSGKYQVVWTRGARTAQTNFVSGKNDHGGQKGICMWDEKLTLISTIYKDNKTKEFMKKKSQLFLKQKKNEHVKTVGRVDLDLADYADLVDRESVTFRVAKCYDSDPRLSISIESIYLQQLDSDVVSIDSSIDFGHEFEPNLTPHDEHKSSHSGSIDDLDLFDHKPKNKQADIGLTSFSSTLEENDSSGYHNHSSPHTHRQSSPPRSSRKLQHLTPNSSSRNSGGGGGEIYSSRGDSNSASGVVPRSKYEKKIKLLHESYKKELTALTQKMQKQKEDFQDSSTYWTSQEVLFVKTKVDLCNAVDKLHDLEMENMKLKEEVILLEKRKTPVMRSIFKH